MLSTTTQQHFAAKNSGAEWAPFFLPSGQIATHPFNAIGRARQRH